MTKPYTCKHCQAQINVEITDAFVVCSNCSDYFAIKDHELKFICKFPSDKIPAKVCFDLGQKIVLNSIYYTVKGITQRNDADYKYIAWLEYTLKSDSGELVFLNEYNGNWQLVKPLLDFTCKIYDIVTYQNTDYALFQKYYQTINWACGNFEFDISDTQNLYSREYIAPPKILINEVKKTGKEETNSEWYLGEYVEEQEVYQNVNSKNVNRFPEKRGIGATEPYVSNFYFFEASKWGVIALMAIIFIQLCFLFYTPEKNVFEQDFRNIDLKYDSISTYSVTPKPIISKSFTIDKTSKIKIKLLTNVDNSWLESNITMINEKTGDELPIVLAAEFYHGYEDGENWSEGDKIVSKDYSAVPAGKYHLLIEVSSPLNEAGWYTVQLNSGGMYFSNLIIMIILIACVPIYLYFQERNFEVRRWEDSDFSPYATDE